MAERALRSRSARISARASSADQGLKTPESTSLSQSGIVEGNSCNDMSPSRHVKEPQSRKRVPTRLTFTRPKKKPKRNDVYDDPETLLANHNSPLFEDSVNIKNIILHTKALAVLGSSTTRYQALESDILSTAVAAFKEDGVCGRFDPAWIRESMAASELRAAGQTAEYEEYMFNETWKSERETLSDDEDDPELLQHNGDGDKEADCDSTSCSNSKESVNGAVSPSETTGSNDTAGPNDEVPGYLSPDSNRQQHNEMDIAHHPPDAQIISHAPTSQPLCPGVPL